MDKQQIADALQQYWQGAGYDIIAAYGEDGEVSRSEVFDVCSMGLHTVLPQEEVQDFYRAPREVKEEIKMLAFPDPVYCA